MYKNLNPVALGVTGHESEIIELALTYGFRGMDVNLGEITRRARQKGIPYAKRLIASARARTGFRIGSAPLPCQWDVDDEVFKVELDRLAEDADVAKEIGCTCCVAQLEPAGDKRPYHENFEFHRHRLAEICKTLESRGVWLGIAFQAAAKLREGHAFQFIHDLDALKLMINMVGAANIGMCLDTGDLHVSGATAEDLRELKAEQIVMVRLADLPDDVPLEEVTASHRLLPMATGRVDVPGMVAALAEIGYGGPLTPMPARARLAAKRRDPAVREAAEAMDRLWEAARLGGESRRVPLGTEQ